LQWNYGTTCQQVEHNGRRTWSHWKYNVAWGESDGVSHEFFKFLPSLVCHYNPIDLPIN